MDFLGCQQGKPFGKIETHLIAENRTGSRRCPIRTVASLCKDRLQQFQILFHGSHHLTSIVYNKRREEKTVCTAFQCYLVDSKETLSAYVKIVLFDVNRVCFYYHRTNSVHKSYLTPFLKIIWRLMNRKVYYNEFRISNSIANAKKNRTVAFSPIRTKTSVFYL
jgi:hypothetical protein